MHAQPTQITSGIVLFEGRISRNLLLEPMVSNAYLLEDGDEAILFDPSCGKAMANRVEAHVRSRHRAGATWKRAYLIAGHSHIDHANNFSLCDVLGAPETHIYVHEKGFKDGRVKNQPLPFVENVAAESARYYNPYLAYDAPYSLLMAPLAALDLLSPALARKVFGVVGSLPWPAPVDGSVEPEPLKEDDLQAIRLDHCEVRGWRLGSKVILPTPGHSSCSVSLFWRERKALFISDAAWLGNPVFASASLKGSIASLEKLETVAVAEKVSFLFPAHTQAVVGNDQILTCLQFHIRHLQVMRNEVLSAYYACGQEKDVRKLTRTVARRSPLFGILRMLNYPRFVVFVHNIVAVCLREEGILD